MPEKSTGTFGIVVSADTQDDLAAYEVQQLKKRGFADIHMYILGKFLRTVAQFQNKEAAEQALSSIHNYRQGAYIVEVDTFCRNPQNAAKQIENVPVFQCQQ